MARVIDLSNMNKRVVLLLQGGGALGAYQVGAYEVLHRELRNAGRSGVDWVGGISIGSINAAVVAAPKRHKQDPVRELKDLWSDILSPPAIPFDFTYLCDFLPLWGYSLQPLIPKWWNFSNRGLLGQNNFYTPMPVWKPWTLQWLYRENADELGFFDTAPLAATLRKHVDWHRLQTHPENPRLLLGVTSVTTGELQILDSSSDNHDGFIPVTMDVDCVRASCALPPAFPPVRLNGDTYFDGGVSSNTLITQLADHLCNQDTIVFLLDLWDRHGAVPTTMDEIMWRQKCIQYGSRKKSVEWVVEKHQMKAMEHLRTKPGAADLPHTLEIFQLMYESADRDAQFAFSDADFSRQTYHRLYHQGKHDMEKMFEEPFYVPLMGPRRTIGENDCFAVLYRKGSRNKHRTIDHAIPVPNRL
jgi:NTE family protein